jgi:hypothetical protein
MRKDEGDERPDMRWRPAPHDDEFTPVVVAVVTLISAVLAVIVMALIHWKV